MLKLLVIWVIDVHINFLCFLDGQLRKIDPNTGGPGNESFEFIVSENEDYNQKRYEALGDVSVTTLCACACLREREREREHARQRAT
jgi:hypothetical protein